MMDSLTTHHTTYEAISPLRLNLSGRSVLITGTAHEAGIGHATALSFARAGVSFILLADLQDIPSNLVQKVKEAAIQANRPEPVIRRYKVDISDLSSVQSMQEAVSQEFEYVDILVNNAAYMEPDTPFLESDPDLYWRTWEVNVKGLFNIVRAFLPSQLSSRTQNHQGEKGLCTILTLSSSGALTPRTRNASYRASKLALLRWTESLQLEYGAQGLLTFCVNPGAIKTAMTENAPAAVRDALPDRADLAGDSIVWLGGERREWLAGRYVSCQWDVEELIRKREEVGDKLGEWLRVRLVV